MEASAAPLLPDTQLPAAIDSAAGGRSNPEEFRASIEAVRAAQETARARARNQTYRARLIAMVVIAALGIVAWNLSSGRRHRTKVAIAAPAVTPPATAIVPALPVPAAQAVPVAAAVAVSEAPAIPATAGDVAACDSAFAEHRWQSVVTTCAAAFNARPLESAIAMRVAQAQHRLGHVAAAGVWARNAIALDDGVAEAFVILARAEAQAGHPRATTAAYRRYLQLAPHGWHASEARRALAR